VEASVKAQQDALDSIDKGEKCPSRHSKVVSAALKNLIKAKSDKKKAKDAYAKAKKTTIDFGKFTYDQLTPGQCGSFFNQAAYKNAATAVKSAKAKADKAAGALTASQKAYDAAVADQKSAINKCHCDIKKLQKATLQKMNSDVKVANTKLYKRAADLRCLLDGTPASKCKVGALPVVVPVKVTAATAAAKCGPTGLVVFDSVTGNARHCGKGCVYKKGGTFSWYQPASAARSLHTLTPAEYEHGYGFCATRAQGKLAMIGLFDNSKGWSTSTNVNDITYAMDAGTVSGTSYGKAGGFNVYYDNTRKLPNGIEGWKIKGQACVWITKEWLSFWTNSDSNGWRSRLSTKSYPKKQYKVVLAMYSPYFQFQDMYWISTQPIKGSKGKPAMA